LTFTLTLAFISAFANIGGSAKSISKQPLGVGKDHPEDDSYNDDYYGDYYNPFQCFTDQVLTIRITSEYICEETSWVLEKYENDVWTEVASIQVTYNDFEFESKICLDPASVYRFNIFDSRGDGLCDHSPRLWLNHKYVESIPRFERNLESMYSTVFNTCVDESGMFTVALDGHENQTITCDDLVDFIERRALKGMDSGKWACKKDNLDGPGLVRDFCPNTCGYEGQGECAFQ